MVQFLRMEFSILMHQHLRNLDFKFEWNRSNCLDVWRDVFLTSYTLLCKLSYGYHSRHIFIKIFQPVHSSAAKFKLSLHTKISRVWQNLNKIRSGSFKKTYMKNHPHSSKFRGLYYWKPTLCQSPTLTVETDYDQEGTWYTSWLANYCRSVTVSLCTLLH